MGYYETHSQISKRILKNQNIYEKLLNYFYAVAVSEKFIKQIIKKKCCN